MDVGRTMVKINWNADESEIKTVKRIVEKFSDSKNVRRREKRNVNPKSLEIDRSQFWEAHLFAQLTSRQRAGPKNPVHKFDKDKLSLKKCRDSNDVEDFVSTELKEFGGIRFYNNIGEACKKNLNLLEKELQNGDKGWDILEGKLKKLARPRKRKPKPADADLERKICYFLYDEIRGEGLHRIGPKQSRNLLQALGFTRYETPLDSRISIWLNKNLDIPYRLSADGLSNSSFYDFNMDLVQFLCSEAGILPCIFDAAVFTSFDTS